MGSFPIFDRNSVTTFYVTNLPGGVSRMVLWRAFQQYGEIKDAYVARKRDSRGNYFGFVRYEGVHDVMTTLQGMNTVRIFEAKVSVSVAKFDKNHRSFQYNTQGALNDQRQRPAAQKGDPLPQKKPVYEYRPVKKGMTYSEVVRGKQDIQPKTCKTVVAEERIEIYPDHCMMRAVILELKGVGELKEIRRMMDVGGYGEFPVSYLGGLKCMVVLKEKGHAIEFMKYVRETWSQVIVAASLWRGEDLQYDRLVWVKIFGIPIHLRASSLYNRVGECFGKIVGESEFSWADSDNSDSGVWILTEIGKRIEEVVNVEWGGKSYKVWVCEEVNPWVKDVIGELSVERKSSPTKSSESAAAPTGKEKDGENRGGEKVGEETIGQPRDMESSSPMHGVHENNNEDAINMAAGDLNKKHYNDGGGTRGKEQAENISVENINEVGQGPCPKSRKRPRSARSPQCLDPEEEAYREIPVQTHIRNLERSFDLNDAMNEEEGFAGESNIQVANIHSNGGDESKSGDPPENERQFADGERTDQYIGIATTIVDPDPEVRKETADTVTVGAAVGFQLGGFHDQVSEIIIGEKIVLQ
ncbi:putative RNA recognition motif domain, nucleotide-binding alpha-beta plait domain superfamily [Helianthus annuus]|uniref:RNA recognition motif domain, nucleotide-binding alpha-beta plait domain superfamily n=1 Tax=Helianthus annuus TaxID=4232 RepID=A0A9K3HSY1_HELAN|nr:putative RNA recognition motif domain, nucleotide-binding alpha-beta plait domain superfamily [Helianthus annuus]